MNKEELENEVNIENEDLITLQLKLTKEQAINLKNIFTQLKVTKENMFIRVLILEALVEALLSKE